LFSRFQIYSDDAFGENRFCLSRDLSPLANFLNCFDSENGLKKMQKGVYGGVWL